MNRSSSAWENTFVWRIEDEESSSPGMLRKKVAENLKNWKDAAIKRKILKNSEDWKIFTQPDQESRTASRLRDQVRRLPELLVFVEDSKIFYDPDSPSSYGSAYVSHQALITSSSREPSRDIGMLRNTREEMSIPGNVFECQHARRDPDELHDDSRNLATTSAILRRNWEKWKRRTIAIDTFSLLFEKSKTKSLDGGKCPVSMTNHTVGIGTCIQGMAIPSYLSSEMHLQKFPDQTKFSELGREFPSRNLRKGEESRARAWSRDERKGATFLHRAGDWRMFSAEDNWVLFKKRHLIVFHTRMPRDSVRLCWKKWETEGSPRTSILFSTESEGTDWREKDQSLKASPATGV